MPDMEKREPRKLSLEEQQIVSCLNCWKGVRVMRDYRTICRLAEKDKEIMDMLNARKRNPGIEEDFKELTEFFGFWGNVEEKRLRLEPFIKGSRTWEVRKEVIGHLLNEKGGSEVIEELSGLLGIQGSIEEKYEVLRGLSSMGEYGNTEFRAGDFIEEKSAVCLANLPSILTEMKEFYNGNEIEMETKRYKSHRKHIFSVMHEINKEYADKNEYETEKCERSLKLFEKRIAQDDEKKREKFREGLLHIFETFCCACDREKFDIMEGRVCEAATFLRDMMDSSLGDGIKESGDFNRRFALLSGKSREVMVRYLRNAPKNLAAL